MSEDTSEQESQLEAEADPALKSESGGHVHGPNCNHGHSHGPPIQQVVRDAPKVGRNDPCTCGSGKKFKKCCANKEA